MRHEITEPSFLEMTQQDMGTLTPHAEGDAGLQYTLDRACTPHCIGAITELESSQPIAFEDLFEYINFIREHGAHGQTEQKEGMYTTESGWNTVALADLLRLNQHAVVLQHLGYRAQDTDIMAAALAGRVRSTSEEEKLSFLKTYGGEHSGPWLGAISHTLQSGGYAIASLEIPSSKTPGVWTRHSVAVLAVNEASVTYFDPDKLAIDRYGVAADEQVICREEEGRLIYSQAAPRFLNRMTGEVMHIFRET